MNCVAQNQVRVLSVTDSLPVPFAAFQKDSRHYMLSDSLGILTVPSRRTEIYPLHDPEPIGIGKGGRGSITDVYVPLPVDSSLAAFDIRNGKLVLHCMGGFVTMAYTAKDREFESRYNVKYRLSDCVRVASAENICAYNRQVAAVLDAKYGTGWRLNKRSDARLTLPKPTLSQ